MATAKEVPATAATEASAQAPAVESYVLIKNFGPVIGGRSYFWAAGSEFSLPEDGETLSLMFQHNAPLQRKGA